MKLRSLNYEMFVLVGGMCSLCFINQKEFYEQTYEYNYNVFCFTIKVETEFPCTRRNCVTNIQYKKTPYKHIYTILYIELM